MTRKSTTRLRQQLADQEAADDALAGKLTALNNFLDKTERARIERDNALKAAIDEDQQQFLAELRTMKAEIASVAAELRGTPVQIEGQKHDEKPVPFKIAAGE